jgi:hypothetical protein
LRETREWAKIQRRRNCSGQTEEDEEGAWRKAIDEELRKEEGEEEKG